MIEKVTEVQLCEITKGKMSVAIAECIEGLGCSVYADGAELIAPWASNKVGELVGIHVDQGAIIGTQAQPRYFILRREGLDAFELLSGPLSAVDLISGGSRVAQVGR